MILCCEVIQMVGMFCFGTFDPGLQRFWYPPIPHSLKIFEMYKCYLPDLVVKSDHCSPQCNLFYIQIFMFSNYVNLAISNLFIFIHFHHDLQRSIESYNTLIVY